MLVREFQPADADAVSMVVRQTMRVSNSADYGPEVLDPAPLGGPRGARTRPGSQEAVSGLERDRCPIL